MHIQKHKSNTIHLPNNPAEGLEVTMIQSPEGPPPGVFSIARGKISAQDGLEHPLYFTSDELVQTFSQTSFLDVGALLGIFELTKEGELLVTDKAVLDSHRGVISEVIKKATLSLIQGRGLMKVSLPARLFNPINSHESICKFLSALDQLRAAAEASTPLVKFQHFMAFFVGGVMISAAVKKPFNSLIGDTFQGHFADGSDIFIEHVAHEPPTDAFILENKKFNFRLTAKLELTPKLGANEIKVAFRGLIEGDIGGEKMYAQIGSFVNKGLLMGHLRVIVEDNFHFYYPAENLKGLIKVGKGNQHDTIRGGIFVGKAAPVLTPEKFGGSLFKSTKSSKLEGEQRLSEASGSIFRSLSFDGKEFVSRNSRFFKAQIPLDSVLPSDNRYRDDIIYYLRGDLVSWEKWKLKLEDLNREWRKIRAKVGKSRPKPSNK